MTKVPSRREAAEMLLTVDHGRESLAERMRVPAWALALQGLALVVLFLLPGLSSRPGHELRGISLALPIAFSTIALSLLDGQLIGRRGVRMRSDRGSAYPSARRPVVVSGAVVLVGCVVTWAVAITLSWVASLPIGLLFAGLAFRTRLEIHEATVADVRAGRTRPR